MNSHNAVSDPNEYRELERHDAQALLGVVRQNSVPNEYRELERHDAQALLGVVRQHSRYNWERTRNSILRWIEIHPELIDREGDGLTYLRSFNPPFSENSSPRIINSYWVCYDCLVNAYFTFQLEKNDNNLHDLINRIDILEKVVLACVPNNIEEFA